MVDRHLVAVLLRQQPGHDPLPRAHPQLGPLHVLGVEYRTVIGLDVVVRCLVADADNLLCEHVSPHRERGLVHRQQLAVRRDPAPEDCPDRKVILPTANRAHALASPDECAGFADDDVARARGSYDTMGAVSRNTTAGLFRWKW